MFYWCDIQLYIFARRGVFVIILCM